MQILPFDPTNEAFLNWYVADAGQNPSDFILLGSDLRNGRALHRRLPPLGGLIHFHIDDDLDLLLVFSDDEWPLICAAASITLPPGVPPAVLQQSQEESCLTTPKVSFTHGTERWFRRFDNHPVLARDKIVGNKIYPDTVWDHYILTLGNPIWAEVILIYEVGDDPDAIDDPYSDEQNWGLPFVGKWVGHYLDAPQLLDWFVTHRQQPPQTLISALFEFAVLKVRQLPPITTPIHGQPPVADPTQVDPMPPRHVEETPPAANEDISDGYLGGGSPDIELTVAQVAQWVRLEPNSMTAYRKEWGQPAVPHRGRRPARYLLSAILSTLKRQFPELKDWTDIGKK
jgi:hypothetical protein